LIPRPIAGLKFSTLDPQPDPGGKNEPQEKEKSEEMYCFEVQDVLF
jgi:hypothetical protein